MHQFTSRRAAYCHRQDVTPESGGVNDNRLVTVHAKRAPSRGIDNTPDLRVFARSHSAAKRVLRTTQTIRLKTAWELNQTRSRLM